MQRARDRGGRQANARLDTEELAQLGRDAMIVRHAAPSFSASPSCEFLGRLGDFGRRGFTISLVYDKSGLRSVRQMGYQSDTLVNSDFDADSARG